MIWVEKNFWKRFGNGKWNLAVLLFNNLDVWVLVWIGFVNVL